MKDKNPTDALRKLALAGDANAQFNLAHALWNGEGVGKDKDDALNWYLTAALQGNPDHEMGFGLILCWEESNRRNFSDGFEWILRAARHGLVAAQYFAAVEYATGENISRELTQAAFWYKKAAIAGHAEAKYNLGIMLLLGEGIPKDVSQAEALIVSAANEGELLAIRFLRDAYSEGALGIEANFEKAEHWRKQYQRTVQRTVPE